VTDEVRAQRRIERLNRLYQYLSDANKAVFTATSTHDIMQSVVRQAVGDGGFLLAWGGLVDE
jgi:hypothetical protein